MRGILEGIRSFSDELTRRRVYRASAYYLGGAFVAIQVADILFEALGFAPWLLTLAVLLAITGFPIVLVLAWIFDLSVEGVRRADPTVHAAVPGLHALFGGAVIVLSVGVAGASWWLWLTPDPAPAEAQVAGEISPLEPWDPRRIAVLYFDDHSRDRSLGYLADGLTEGLIHELAGVEGILVASRNGVKPFRDRDVPLDSIVRTLRVGSVVEGSVASSGDSVLVTVQLIDASTGDHLTSGQLRAPLTDLLHLQRSVSVQVARVLRQHLGREIRLREHRAGASSSEAWSLVQRAHRLMEDDFSVLLDRDEDGLRRTLAQVDSLLVQASRLDPQWAEPVYRRGLVAEHRASLEAGSVDVAEGARALTLATAAAELDESDGRAWALMGRIRRDLATGAPADSAARLRARAEADFRVAVDRSPDMAQAWGDLSDLLVDQGRHAEARQAARRAFDMDAFLESAPDIAHHLFYSSLNLKDFGEAGRWCEEGRTRFTTDHRFVLCGLLLLVSDPALDPDVAWAWSLVDSLEERLNPSSRATFRRYGAVQVAKVAARAGLPDSARAILREHAGEPPPGWLAYDAAHLYLLLGEPPGAILGLLDRYLEAQPSMRETLAEDWWFESLHADPGFVALVDTPD